MAAPRPTKNKPDQLIALTREIADLSTKVNSVYLCLIGDGNPLSASKGLIKDVKGLEQDIHTQKNRIIALEEKMRIQEMVAGSYKDTIAEITPIIDKVKEGTGIAKRLWALVALVITGCGGAIIAHVLHWGSP